MSKALTRIEIGGRKPDRSGKVRDIFDLGENLLIVTSDRLSAFDVVLPDGIPGRGETLTRLSVYWFNALAGVMATHFLTDRVQEFGEPFSRHADLLAGRSMLVRKAQRVDVECVVRGYLAGSGWKDYRKTGAVCGVALPSGLREADRLPEPIFTPSTKNDTGHDENISFEEAEGIAGSSIMQECRRLSLALYSNLAAYAETRGIILADTKFEFGVIDGTLSVIDEVASPDSSRFWDKASWRPGENPESFDKQFVRDWLEASGWDKTPPAPELPAEVVAKTSARYAEAARRLIDTAHPLSFRETPFRWS